MKVPVSVVITILDEAKTIGSLLTALSQQTYQPSEVLILDGGSTDETLDLIKAFQAQHHTFPLLVSLVPGTNRSQARNQGVRLAKHDVIAVTDAGCVPKSTWLEELMQPFMHDKGADAVAGFYDPAPKNVWENVIANFTSTRFWNFDEKSYLPSSRSLAFSRKAWQKAGGYPEELETCEDLVFAEKLKNQSKQWYVNKKAQVIWPQPKTVEELRDKIFHYALGDLQAEYVRHVRRIKAAIWRVIVLLFLAFPLLFAAISWIRLIGISFVLLYLVGTWGKHRRVLNHPLSFVYTVFLQIMVDSALVQAFLYHHLGKTIKK